MIHFVFLNLFCLRINYEKYHDASHMPMSTVAVQWGQEVFCVNLTIIPSAARLTSSSSSSYEKAVGAMFITPSPSIDNVQILERWMKEIKSRTTNQISTFFIIQKCENPKIQEKAASNSLILEKGFDDVVQITTGSTEQAQKVVKKLVWNIMGKEPHQITNSYGALLATASKGAIGFGDIF